MLLTPDKLFRDMLKDHMLKYILHMPQSMTSQPDDITLSLIHQSEIIPLRKSSNIVPLDSTEKGKGLSRSGGGGTGIN